MALQCAFYAHLNGCALFPLPALGGDLVDAGRAPGRGVGLLQPFVEQRFQLAHVFKAQLERLEPADGRLGEDVPVEGAQGQAHVRLREPQLDSPLFELFGKMLQVVRRGGVLIRLRIVAHAVVLVVVRVVVVVVVVVMVAVVQLR